MTRSVLTITPQALVKDAAIVLAGHGVTLLPVVNVMSDPPLTTDPYTDAAELATMMIDGVVHAEVVRSSRSTPS
ncbi:MAG: CBS domain-containing protein [Pseudonocardiaceae bacterium]